MEFPRHAYVNLESLSDREFATTDPIAFLRQFEKSSVVIDEIQRVPQLLSQIQVSVDQDSRFGRFILTGSQNFSMMKAVAQSLAGRTAICTLLPLSMAELGAKLKKRTVEEVMWRGFYPKLHVTSVNPADELSFYVTTYLERDVRDLENLRNLRTFSIFLRLAAGRTGQVLNVSSLAADAGISPKVATEWLSLLEASYVVTLLEPWHANLNKRLVKAPKLYFNDVGLACNLIGISEPGQLTAHPLRGALFETMVVDEFLKRRANAAGHWNINYYRDSNRNEIDLVVDNAGRVGLYEIKSGATFSSDWTNTMDRLFAQFGLDVSRTVIYGGEKSQLRSGFELRSWREL
ncbi:MAG: ATP-binding protein [Kiritimatiellae bacterium]|nr:ATP-binding protein [Kiritimatiellia bacterium]